MLSALLVTLSPVLASNAQQRDNALLPAEGHEGLEVFPSPHVVMALRQTAHKLEEEDDKYEEEDDPATGLRLPKFWRCPDHSGPWLEGLGDLIEPATMKAAEDDAMMKIFAQNFAASAAAAAAWNTTNWNTSNWNMTNWNNPYAEKAAEKAAAVKWNTTNWNMTNWNRTNWNNPYAEKAAKRAAEAMAAAEKARVARAEANEAAKNAGWDMANSSQAPASAETYSSILLSVAAYRDFQCSETVQSALSRATYPERISVTVVEQTVPGAGDPSCTPACDTEEAFATDVRCKHADRIKVFWMDARNATGPVLARHVSSRMYRGEAFVLQVDAHVQFAQGWDESIFDQWRKTGNENAVLTTYLSDVQGSLDAEGHSLRTTRPIMCNSAFVEGNTSVPYMRHGAQPEEEPAIKDQPMLQPFWAAGFSFARGHFVARVPYDCCLPFVFQGEELSMTLRGWTHGYDFYAPTESVVFHEYAESSPRRRPVKQFWENRQGREAIADDSMKRLLDLAGMLPTPPAPGSYNDKFASKYTLGVLRVPDQYFKLFLINPAKRLAVNLCNFVRSATMHRSFQKHLRQDGKGIDYDELREFDTLRVTPSEPQPQPARRVMQHLAWL